MLNNPGKVSQRNLQTILDPWSLIALPGVIFIFLCFGSVMIFTLSRGLTDPGPANYVHVFQGMNADAFLNTFASSAIVTLAVLIMGYVYAYAMRIGPKWLRLYLMIFLAIQFATSSVARAYAWVQLLQTHGVVNKFLLSAGLISHPLPLMRNDLGAIIGTSHVLLPHMILILYASMRQVDLSTIAMARSLGASTANAFWQVFVPATRPGIISGCGLIFVLGLSFYATPALLGNISRQMISALIMTQAEYGNFGMASALSVLLVCVTLLIMLAVNLALRVTQRRSAI